MPNAMHTLDSNSSNVPAFLVKLWKLVEDPTCDDLIAWNDSGYSFIIKDQANFAKDLLPQYFKHNNMASFIRQLNMYGFKKVMNIEKSGLKNENNEMEFQHGFFVKERSELLELIKRKISNSKIAETPVAKTNAKDILIDLSSIREKQENMDNMLLKMKSENELLWRELTSMRQKHKAQEQIIQKVIQFLVSIVQRNNPNIGVQRKISRMLHNSPSSKVNSSQVSRTIDVLRKKNSDCIIVPEQMASPLGPVIHEVLDGEHDENQSSAAFLNISVASPSVKSPESVKDPSDDSAPKYHLVSLLNNTCNFSGSIEPLRILEAFTPKTPATDTENTAEESILGIPLEFITVAGDAEVADVVSIPDTGEVIATNDAIGNVISIPEDGSINDIITLSQDAAIGNTVTVPGETRETKDCKSTSHRDHNLGSAEEDVSQFLTDGIVSLCDLQPSTSQDMVSYTSDYQDDILSESLQTPEVHTIDEDPYISPIKDSKQKSKEAKKSQVCSNNYQLATTESSSLAKNVLSNHLVSVDEKLNFTQDRLASNPWNFDVQKLLGVCASPYSWTSLDTQLFSTDELVNYDAFINLSNEMNIKSEPCDVTGNELVQFSPMLDVADIANSPLFEALSEQPEVLNEDLNYHPFVDEVLNKTDTSEGLGTLSNEIVLTTSPNKRRKAASSPGKNKRHKAK